MFVVAMVFFLLVPCLKPHSKVFPPACAFCQPDLFVPLLPRRPHQTVMFLRHRLTIGRSIESTRRPRGIIQNPRIGRNPNMPPITRSMPIITRARRDRGNFIVLLPNVTFGAIWRAPFPYLACILLLFSWEMWHIWPREALMARLHPYFLRSRLAQACELAHRMRSQIMHNVCGNIRTYIWMIPGSSVGRASGC